MKIDLNDIDVNNVLVRPPKKIDESYICKVDYSDGKLELVLQNVKLLRAKMLGPNSFYLYVKPSKTIISRMVELEEHFISTAQTSCSKWFQKKLNPELIEEYFQSSSSIDRIHGNILRFKINEMLPDFDLSSIADGSIIDLTLRLHSIKFYRQSFNIVWSFIDGVKSNTFKNFIEDESVFINDDDESDVDESCLGPSAEELVEIVQDLRDKIDNLINILPGRIEMLQKGLVQMITMKEKVDSGFCTTKEILEFDLFVSEYDQ